MKFSLFLFSHLFAVASAVPRTLNLTALSASNGASTLECWQLTSHFQESSQAGTVGSAILQLGSLANASFTVLPPRFDGGAHNAPNVQYVVFTSGLAHITLPESKDEAWVQGGKYGTIIAADTAKVSRKGHNTTYPCDEQTIALQLPTTDGKVPPHTVLHSGACKDEEMQLES